MSAFCVFQLTVRRASLSAASRLMRAFPHHDNVCKLWVHCTLPLLCDVEKTIQETALDSFCENVIGIATAIGAASRQDTPSIVADGQRLRLILGMIVREGTSMVSCLGIGCSAARSKGTLRAQEAAHGIEQIIDGVYMRVEL